MMNKYLGQFLNHIDVELGYSSDTCKTYRIILWDFLRFLSAKKIKLKILKKKHIGEYILYLREERKNAAKSIRLKLEVIKTFINFLSSDHKEHKVFKKNPISPSDFKYKVEKKDVESLSEENVDALLASLQKEINGTEYLFETSKGKKVLLKKKIFAVKRDSVLIKLLLAVGLRVSEALNIKVIDIDFIDRSIRILGKGKKYRQIFFDLDGFEDEFLAYVENRKKLNVDHEYIFVSIKDYKPLNPRGFQLLLKKYLKEAKLSSTITPHTLRHTYATLSIEKGANIKAVSQILGHSSCKITIDLYTHLSNKHLRDVIQKCNPLSKKSIPLSERIEGRKKHLAYFEKTG